MDPFAAAVAILWSVSVAELFFEFLMHGQFETYFEGSVNFLKDLDLVDFVMGLVDLEMDLVGFEMGQVDLEIDLVEFEMDLVGFEMDQVDFGKHDCLLK